MKVNTARAILATALLILGFSKASAQVSSVTAATKAVGSIVSWNTPCEVPDNISGTVSWNTPCEVPDNISGTVSWNTPCEVPDNNS